VADPPLRHRTFPTRDIRSKQARAFASRLSRERSLLQEEKDCLRGYPGYQKEGTCRHGQHDDRPKMMIVRLPAQWGVFLSSARGWRFGNRFFAAGGQAEQPAAEGNHQRAFHPVAW
jgi:hypothetical protein